MTSMESSAPMMRAPKLIANMKDIDEKATLMYGIAGLELMENAGKAVTKKVLDWADHFPEPEKANVLILCGPGNNGGDGFVTARHLAEAGFQNISVWYFESSEGNYKADAAENLKRLKEIAGRHSGLQIKVWPDTEPTEVPKAIEHPIPQIVVDALFGSGLNRPIQNLYGHWINWVNQCHQKGYSKIVAIDVPSGLDSKTGDILGSIIEADTSITLAAGKPGLYLENGRQYAGIVEVVDIGIPQHLVEEDESDTFLITPKFALEGIPKRLASGHKYQMGHVLVIGGSYKMPGAARLCAEAALSAGAGMVTLASPLSVFETMNLPPELIRLPLDETEEGTMANTVMDDLLPALSKADTVILGPGLSQEKETQEAIEEILSYLLNDFTGVVVLDADGLNALAQSTDHKGKLNHRFVLTPHIGEAKRLAKGVGIPQDEDAITDRCAYASQLSRAYQCPVVLKSASTIVSDGLWRAINPTGNNGMATAGSGDVLSGILGGLLAQWHQQYPNQAHIDITQPNPIASAVYLHGLAGDCAVLDMGAHGLRASHLITFLPDAFFTLGDIADVSSPGNTL